MTNQDRKDGGPAYPVAFTTTPLQGMSLRDYFAASVLQGMFANDALIGRYAAQGQANMISPEVLAATAAYSIADAMIKEREQ